MKLFKFTSLCLAIGAAYTASANAAFTGFSVGGGYGYQMNTVKYDGQSYSPKLQNINVVTRYGFPIGNNFVGFTEASLSTTNSQTESFSSTVSQTRNNGGTFGYTAVTTGSYKFKSPINLGLFVGAGYLATDNVMPYIKVGLNNHKFDLTGHETTNKTVNTSISSGGNGNAKTTTTTKVVSVNKWLLAPAVSIGSRFAISQHLEAAIDYQASWASSSDLKINSHTISASLSYRF